MKIKKYIRGPTDFGGSLDPGTRKKERPLSFENPNHLVLKAIDSCDLLQNKDEIEKVIRRLAEKFDVNIHELGIQPDHVHMVPNFLDRSRYGKWIRSVTGVLARKFKIKWKVKPFTKTVDTPEYFRTLVDYVKKNKEEGEFRLQLEAWFRNTSRPPEFLGIYVPP